MSLVASLNESAIVFNVANGDHRAFRQLFDQYHTPLFNYAVELTKSAHDAEDLVQEIFVKIWVNRSKLSGVDEAKPYIYAIARNHIFDYLRKVSKNRLLLRELWKKMETDLQQPSIVAYENENRELIAHAISLLPTAKQEVFRLSREDGLTHEQIGAILGLSKSRVKNIMVELLKVVREQLTRHTARTSILILLCFGAAGVFLSIL